jgi:hypothetical protein
MTPEIFNSSWIVYYDWYECAYDIMVGSDWLKHGHEHWVHQRMPTRVMLDIAETEAAAVERLKNVPRQRQVETVGRC